MSPMPPGGIAEAAFFLGLLGDHRLGGDEERRDRGRVLEGEAHDLCRVDDAPTSPWRHRRRLSVLAVVRIVLVEQLADDDRASAPEFSTIWRTGVWSARGRYRRRPLVVVVDLELVERLAGVRQRNAAAGDDTLLDPRPSSRASHRRPGPCAPSPRPRRPADADDGNAPASFASRSWSFSRS